ncbi:MAG: SOS response-associated peptidase, partial [Magnetospirillum sp.]|nr:SOS response-associated peptidase [Magnetospirillum sp.]
MCSRFELKSDARSVCSRFGLTVPPPWANRAEIRPTDAALVIGAGPGEEVRGGRVLHWGFEVDWDKRPLINARAETLSSRVTFRRLLGSRVLVPATSWWEWRHSSDGKTKTKMRLGLADGALFAMAGLVDGGRFTLITCPPSAAIAHVHDRMPLVLAPAAEAAWTDPEIP